MHAKYVGEWELHASQALMMRLVWKCAISTWAWVLAIIPQIPSQLKTQITQWYWANVTQHHATTSAWHRFDRQCNIMPTLITFTSGLWRRLAFFADLFQQLTTSLGYPELPRCGICNLYLTTQGPVKMKHLLGKTQETICSYITLAFDNREAFKQKVQCTAHSIYAHCEWLGLNLCPSQHYRLEEPK